MPLTGDEIRACWEAADTTGAAIPALPGVGPVWPLAPDGDRTAVREIQFVEVPPGLLEAVGPGPADGSARLAAEPQIDSIFLAPAAGGEPRWSLWGEPEA